MPRLIDRSGGVWSEIITRRKNANLVITQRVIPDERLMFMIGEEAVSSIKGSIKHKFSITSSNGKVHFARFHNGTYPYGIMKRISPDGEKFEPLSETTVKEREWSGVDRGRPFILRRTSEHIMEGLKVLYQSRGPRGGKRVEIGWRGEDERLAILNDKGGSVTTDLFDRGPKTVNIPARPFRGFQEEFIRNFYDIMAQVLR